MNQNMPKVYACQKLPPSLMNCLQDEVLGLFFDTTYILRNHSILQEKVGTSWNGCSLVDREGPIFLTKEVLFIPEKVAVDSEMRPFYGKTGASGILFENPLTCQEKLSP